MSNHDDNYHNCSFSWTTPCINKSSPDPNTYPHLPLQLPALSPFLANEAKANSSDKDEQDLETAMELHQPKLHTKVLPPTRNPKLNLKVEMITKVLTGSWSLSQDNQELTTQSLQKHQKLHLPVTAKLKEDTTPTLKLIAKHSTYAPLMVSEALPNIPSSAQMEPSLTKNTSSAIGGSTLTAQKLKDFTLWTMTLPLNVKP